MREAHPLQRVGFGGLQVLAAPPLEVGDEVVAEGVDFLSHAEDGHGGSALKGQHPKPLDERAMSGPI